MKRIHVLCAMRDGSVVRMLRRSFGERCLFVLARDGHEAICAALRMTPDILVVDAVLPKVDGVGVIARLQGMLGERMPPVIGGSVMRFSDEAFMRMGVSRTLSVPWEFDALRDGIAELIAQSEVPIDWAQVATRYARAEALLGRMGMNSKLRGYAYLSWAAALASENEERLNAVGKRLYGPIAERCATTPQSVERLIRHAVERTADTVGAQGIYTFFGNTIDPMRGKPTNAQMIAMMAQMMRLHHAAAKGV